MRTILFLSLAASLFADEFPKPFNTGTDVGKKPMSADEAVKLIKMPEGFKATVFAAEPDVQNPIACAWDSRGRLWVAENYTYAEAAVGFDKRLRDRILIFEDTDNDGKADKRTVFADNLHNLTSIELGYGGVYATAAPYLLWIPDADGDDKPDAPKDEKDKKAASRSIYQSFPSYEGTSTRILLDGFDAGGVRHNFVNGLRWGPDGWLYGRHGILATSKVGTPGTPDAERLPINVGIWRWHPTRHTVEMVTYGGTNPWGLDFNAEGEGFFTNTVTGHLYHMIPGAHYERMYGEDPNPYIYQLLPQTADHYHYDRSQSWTASRDGKANDFGGGHAHVGCMIYQGENWPEQYRGKLFTINLHGRCINVERLERKGSGYTAKHEPSMITFGDPWFRGNELTYGPDGGVYVLDWSDQGECHENDGVHRESGRIYKITYGDAKKPTSDALGLVVADVTVLLKHALGENEWSARIARRILGERAFAVREASHLNGDGTSADWLRDTKQSVTSQTPDSGASLRTLRGMWTKAWLGFSPREDFASYFASPNEYVRCWSVRCFFATPFNGDPLLDKYFPRPKFPKPQTLREEIDQQVARMAYTPLMKELVKSANSFVQVSLIGNLPRIDRLSRESFIKDLTRTMVTVGDTPMGVLLAQQLSLGSASEAASLIDDTKDPIVVRILTRRASTELARTPEILSHLFDRVKHPLSIFPQVDIQSMVEGLDMGLRGVAKLPRPPAWESFASAAGNIPDIADKMIRLNAIFGDGRQLDEIRGLVLNNATPLPVRRQGLETLTLHRVDDLPDICRKLIGNRDLTAYAIIALVAHPTYSDSQAAELAISSWPLVPPDMRPMVIGHLSSRAIFADALLDAVAVGKIERNSISPYHARQIAALGGIDRIEKLSTVWGSVATTSDQKKARMAELRAALTPEVMAKADIENGRTIFTATCAACHTLYDLGQTGANLGPNLTGSGRGDINYLLENIVDPSAIVPADYKLSTVTMKDGRVLSGFISTQNAQTLTLRTMTETQTLDRTTVAKTEASAQSLMPEGILDALKPEQIRDLFGFLMKK